MALVPSISWSYWPLECDVGASFSVLVMASCVAFGQTKVGWSCSTIYIRECLNSMRNT